MAVLAAAQFSAGAHTVAAVWRTSTTAGATTQAVGLGLTLTTEADKTVLAVTQPPATIAIPLNDLVGGVVLSGVPGVSLAGAPPVDALGLVDAHGHVLPLSFGCGRACLAQPPLFTPLAALPFELLPIGRSGIGPGLGPHSTPVAPRALEPTTPTHHIV